jgi:hypothetical protein
MFILGRRKGGVSARTSQRGASRGHDWEIQMCREEGPTETCLCFDIVIRCAGATSKFHENLVSVLFLAPGTDGHISVTASQARDFHPREAATKKNGRVHPCIQSSRHPITQGQGRPASRLPQLSGRAASAVHAARERLCFTRGFYMCSILQAKEAPSVVRQASSHLETSLCLMAKG